MKEEFGTQLENGSLRFVRDLPGPIDRVWEYLVDPEKRALWFCGGETGAKPGDSFVMKFDHEGLTDEPVPDSHAGLRGGAEMGAKVITLDPPNLFVFRWDNDGKETQIELNEADGRVRLVLIQTPPAELAQVQGMASGWQAHLGLLIDHLAGDAPRGFWSEHEEAMRHYREAVTAGA
ncbi:MAG: SRPBCC family protein [Pseudomonadota bacterium]